MDPSMVAVAVTQFLLVAIEGLGDKIWEKASDAAPDEPARLGRRLLATLLHHDGGHTDPAATETGSSVQAGSGTPSKAAVIDAVNDLVVAPADAYAAAVLELAVRELLAADPLLLAEVNDLLVKTQASVQQADDRTITIGRDQSGVLMTGDRNTISLIPLEGPGGGGGEDRPPPRPR
jgi:hypothetical protein